MKRNEHTRDKIVELSRDNIQRLGYHAFNYQQIARELDIKNAAIHYYFPTKEDLGLEVLKKDMADFDRLAQGVQTKKPGERIDALLNIYRHYFDNGQKLCVIGSFGANYQDVPESIQEAARAYMAKVLQWLTSVFKDGVAAGEFTIEASTEMAARWIASLSGSLQIGRLLGLTYFEEILTRLRKELSS